MRAHARTVYDSLTARRGKFVRIDDLCALAARKYPGLVPSAKELARESGLAQVFADPAAGTHLCHAMLLPRGFARAPGRT